MSKEILWISLCAPYDRVSHAGGKTHNFYLKHLIQKSDIHVELISFCKLEEYESVKEDLEKYKIDNHIFPWSHTINAKNIRRKFYLISNELNAYDKFGGATNRYYWECIKEILKERTSCPDVIVMQWTEIVLFINEIKKIYPNAKIIAIEEDVKFLKAQRRFEALGINKIKKFIYHNQYKILKKAEIRALKLADIVISNNFKDYNLLKEKEISNIELLSVYFDNYSSCDRNSNKLTNNIVFLGAMSREDNYNSVIWFIEKVLPKLDKRVCFKVVGGNPPEILKKYISSNVEVTGYVENIKPFFEQSLCFVAPLVSGAGVKVKVLEALSSGIPVLTNEIGIEGIAAIDGQDYFLCNTPEDYIHIINQLISHKVDVTLISESSKNLIRNNYDLEKNAETFCNLICIN